MNDQSTKSEKFLKINDLNSRFSEKPAQDILKWFLENYRGKIAFSTSLGAEDQVLSEMIAGIDRSAKIFTLDTGRLFQETYDLIQLTRSRYKIGIEVYFPERERVEEMVNSKGVNLFYESVENRKLCCHIRKIEPLRRALNGMEIWITGLRREQSITRTDMQLVEWDEGNKIIKLNPLINWTEEDVWDYIEEKNIPYNKLHDKGYKSIGCAPCTRPIKPGEDLRAGRWWWETPEQKECGLHRK